jgi:hypothetical protein
MFFQLALQRSRELGLPPPTEEERAAAAGAAEFNVQQIMGFQVGVTKTQHRHHAH